MKQKIKIIKFLESAFLVLLLVAVFFTPSYTVLAQTACAPVVEQNANDPEIYGKLCSSNGGSLDSNGKCVCGGDATGGGSTGGNVGIQGTCTQTPDCKAGLVCDFHHCGIPVGSSMACSGPNDCAGSSTVDCQNNKCVNTSGVSTAPAAQGQACNPDAATPCVADQGLVCARNTSGSYVCGFPSGSGGGSGGSGGGSSGGSTSGGGDGSATCPAPLVASNGLCLPRSPFTGGLASSGSITQLLLKVVELLLGLAGGAAILVLIIGGYWYISSAGNEEQAEKGRKALVNAIIGIVVIVLSYAIVTIINSALTKTP